MLPEAFDGFFRVNGDVQGYEGLRNATELHISYARSEQIKKFPFIEYAKCWNAFLNNAEDTDPQFDLTSIGNKVRFNYRLKKYLFDILPEMQ